MAADVRTRGRLTQRAEQFDELSEGVEVPTGALSSVFNKVSDFRERPHLFSSKTTRNKKL